MLLLQRVFYILNRLLWANIQLPPPIPILRQFSPLFIPNLDVLLVILSFHFCLVHPLGLFVFCFQIVANPMRPSDLHTCSADLSLLTALKNSICLFSLVIDVSKYSLQLKFYTNYFKHNTCMFK